MGALMRREAAEKVWAQLRPAADGLVPAVAVDGPDGPVLMLAYMDREAFLATMAAGRMHYHSRSRNELWLKGATSGHFQDVRRVRVDCDGDALLFEVDQKGAACHTGARSCFYREAGLLAGEGEDA